MDSVNVDPAYVYFQASNLGVLFRPNTMFFLLYMLFVIHP